MKRVLSLLSLAALPLLLTAQIKQGVVHYEEVRQLNLQIPEEHRAMVGQMPTESRQQYLLYFQPQAALFTNKEAPEEVAEPDFPEGEGGVRIRFRAPASNRYTDLEKGEFADAQEFLGRDFLIEDKVPTYDWKLTGEKKTLLGLPVEKAVTRRDTSDIVAWFSPAIPVSIGPAAYLGLPGLILEVEVDNGQRILRATEFDPQADVAAHLLRPTKGKKVTQAEMDKTREEKMREMGNPNGGPVIRIIRQ